MSACVTQSNEHAGLASATGRGERVATGRDALFHYVHRLQGHRWIESHLQRSVNNILSRRQHRV